MVLECVLQLMEKCKFKALCLLHLLLAVYSATGIFSKIAASQPFLSIQFCLCYGAVIGLLGLYAIGWQQIIKNLPLTTAFANKAVTIVWNIVWGVLFCYILLYIQTDKRGRI